jgi:hypothetical protein
MANADMVLTLMINPTCLDERRCAMNVNYQKIVSVIVIDILVPAIIAVILDEFSDQLKRKKVK